MNRISPSIGPTRKWEVTIGGHQLNILGPADEEALLEDPLVERRFAEDEYMPYWGQLWPAAVMLAEHVLNDEPGRNRSALEVGCGLGLVALAARVAGWDVLATDYDHAALEFTRANALANGLGGINVKYVDWRKPSALNRYSRILASDVLYERRNLQPLADLFNALLADDGVALVSDPNREVAKGFSEVLSKAGLTCNTSSTHAEQPYGRYVNGTIYRIRRKSSDR